MKNLARKLIGGCLLALAGFTTTLNAQTTQVFFDDFYGRALSSAWQIATWVNGPPFGCTFSSQDVHVSKSQLSLSFSGNSGKCAEVRTTKYWQYGAFVVDMKPSAVPGTVSSFFLYDGVAATASHYEIDIEFVGGSGLLHTNYWTAGQQHPQDIDLRAMGIDPYKTSRRYSVSWQADVIVWHVMNDAGQWVEVRRAAAAISAPMRLMMNAWYGDNIGTALLFPGYYVGQQGAAQYDSVWIGQ
ncbi:family 16 glycosylhydrolase [Noviherbaspirillum soli]|uniref:family 16 glycosylhydrolase n=1 Tax=Noviherbaspirillum soli TaxID=1064518 RepID=UPI00188A1AA0|nr:family 16 glycosylhydrolase [Noviherbaspirillum soli]